MRTPAPLASGWQDYIATQMHNQNENQRTAFPAKVVGVNNLSTGSVTIEVSNPRYTDEGVNMDETVILNVPVMMPRTQNSIVYMPIKVGDTGLCIVADNNIDNFKMANNTAPIKVRDDRMKDAMDSVFIPGLAPFSQMSKQHQALKLPRNLDDLTIIHNTGSGAEVNLTLKADGNAEINSAFTVKVNSKDIELTATNSLSLTAQTMTVNAQTTNWTGNIVHQGNYTMTGQATFNGVLFDTHFHSGVTPGNGVSGPVAG